VIGPLIEVPVLIMLVNVAFAFPAGSGTRRRLWYHRCITCLGDRAIMQLALGIDTGGTYTDAVLVNHETGAVLAGAKALTTRHDLSIGIGGAIRAVFATSTGRGAPFAPEDVKLVALSTTLATNALAEGHGGAVCLLLIGYDADLIQRWGFQHDLAANDVVYLEGGHDGLGDEVAPLDEAGARAAILARRETVEAFAISGYFGVRNPAHELRVRALVEELAGRPVTCGHELTSQLNAVRRATTVALNAHLILPLRELMTDVRDTLAGLHITAPLMVVRGDGSLVRAEWAMQRPIETILSGPAASAVGAWHLIRRDGAAPDRRDIWAVDVGGTTTDIAALRDGWPILNAHGARVAGWRTMIEAVDVHTTGLGGDSHVRLDREGRLAIGPRRAVPLSLLASEHPAVVGELRLRVAVARTHRDEEVADFIVPGRQPGSRLPEAEHEILDQLAHGPRSVTQLAGQSRIGALARRRIEELERRGLVRRAGFTPTDALHVLGRFSRWDVEAARLGATLLAEQAGLSVEAFCEEVVRRFSVKVATELVSKVLEDEVGQPRWEVEPTAAALLQRALDRRAADNGARPSDLDYTLTLRHPLVAIGAPVGAYLPQVAEALHTELIIPEHAEVANAVGAVSGGIVQRLQALISPLDGESAVRLHLPDGVRDFSSPELAVAHARQVIGVQIEAMARQEGADQVEVRVNRIDQWAPVAIGLNQQIYLGTELHFTAAGRPSPARR
jgi:N-methylhydantoinase A/oxoprolinase/acetone carboxylase beta subunit